MRCECGTDMVKVVSGPLGASYECEKCGAVADLYYGEIPISTNGIQKNGNEHN